MNIDGEIHYSKYETYECHVCIHTCRCYIYIYIYTQIALIIYHISTYCV